MKSRRRFIKTSLKAGTAISLLGSSIPSLGKVQNAVNPLNLHKAPHPLSILILGGTSFLGPHQIAYAMNRGHTITTFTRGRTRPTIYQKLFNEVESLTGDRENDLESLKGRRWDAVIDNSGHRAKWTRDTASLLKDSVDVYLYTSSTGVYYPYLTENIMEDMDLVLEVPTDINEEQAMEYGYGVMKANSEIEAKKAFGNDRTIIVRPTYMMGPADRTDRFTYWPVRLSKGGEVLIPGKAEDPVQYIDVRDVAGWMIRLIEFQTTGTFNAVGPPSNTGMHAFVYGAHAAFSSPIDVVKITDYDFLKKHNLKVAIPWIMPEGDNYGSARVNLQKGINNGLSYTPLAQSVKDIYEWWYSEAVSDDRRAKMDSGPGSLMSREAGIIAEWKKQR